MQRGRLINKLKRLYKKFYRSQSPKKKERIKKKIMELDLEIEELTKRMLRIIDYKKWVKYVMTNTERGKGTKILSRFENVYPEDEKSIREKLRNIDEKNIEYAICFHSDKTFGKTKKHVAIVFDKLEFFGEAVRKHRYLMWEDTPDFVIPFWVGGYRLYVLIDLNNETIPALLELQKESKIPENYDGVTLQEAASRLCKGSKFRR